MDPNLTAMVLLQRGEPILAKLSNVVLCFPNLVDESLAKKASDLRPLKQAKTPEAVPVDKEVTLHRSIILKRLTIFHKATELALQSLTPAFEALYLAKGVQENLQDFYLKTPDVARQLVEYTRAASVKDTAKDETEKSKGVTVKANEMRYGDDVEKCFHDIRAPFLHPQSGPALFATHQLLFRHSEIFLWDPLQHKETQSFAVRPLIDRQVLSKVKKWLQSSLYITSTGQDPSSDPIRSFAEKAKRVMQERKEQSKISRTDANKGPREIIVESSRSDLQWTPTDIVILQCIRAGLGRQSRVGDNDVFQTIMAHIGKLCGVGLDPHVNRKADEEDREEFYTTSVPQMIGVSLLQRLGLMTPWENVPNMDMEFRSLVATDLAELYTLQPPTKEDLDESIRKEFDLPVYVIDEANANELDDGIAIEKTGPKDEYRIHVFIADPTSALTIEDALAKQAKRRHVTHYHPEGSWPMLPTKFTQKFGLRPREDTGEAKYALRLSAKIDIKTGKILDREVGLARLDQVRVKSYNDVDEILTRSTAGEATVSREETDLKLLHQAAIALEARRRHIGGAFLATAGVNLDLSLSPLPLPSSPLWQLTEEHCPPMSIFAGFPKILHGSQISLSNGPHTIQSRGMVSELMILGGRISGSWATERQIPLLYRSQIGPSNQDRRKLLNLRDENGIIPFESFLQSEVVLQSAKSSITAMEHFAMGINTPQMLNARGRDIDAISAGGYARITSPLRRYTDIINHWQIKSSLRPKNLSSSTSAPFSSEVLLNDLSHYDRMDQWCKMREKSSNTFYMILKLQRGLQHRKGASELEDEEEIEEVNAILDSTFDAIIVLSEIRITQTYQGRVRVHIGALGLRAEMKWNLKAPEPKLAQKVRIRIVDAFVAGPASQLIVEEANE